MMGDESLDFETLAAQSGLRVPVGNAVSTAPPIDPSTTFTGASIHDVHRALEPDGEGFAYGRNANPTVVLLEQALARLEKAEDVVAFGSGMAAIAGAVGALALWPGDAVVAGSDLYGVTRTYLTGLAQYEIATRFVNLHDLHAVDAALAETGARALYLESVTNPLLRVPDVAALVAVAGQHGATTLIDNTFASPYLFRPLELGVDVVIHSATKYMAGHGDATAGVVATSKSLGQRTRDVRSVQGGILSPFESWLTLRGLRTLPVRMDRQCATAAELAAWLEQQPWATHVYYPGLGNHPEREIADRQFGGKFGAMIAFDLGSDEVGTLQFLDELELITPGTSLGDVESLILYPPRSSHRGLTDAERASMGIGPSLVRLSVGLESSRDLKRDLSRAAERAGLSRAGDLG